MKKVSMISKVAATAILGSTIFVGCGGGSGSIIDTITSSFGGVDGYIISLPEAATTDEVTPKSSTTVGAKGKIIFSGTVDANATITVPASAILDRNNNGKLDANDTAIGFEMKGKGSSKYITPLTTLALKNNDAALLELAENFDPVAEAKNLTNDDNTTKQKAKAMIQLTEMVKTVIENAGNTNVLSDINTTSVISDLNGTNATDINVTAIAPVKYQTVVNAKSETVKAVIATLVEAEASDITIDSSSLMVQIFDGKKDVNESVKANISSTVEDNATIYTTAATADTKKAAADALLMAIDNISITNLSMGDNNITFVNSAVTSSNLERRELQYDANSSETFALSFDISDAISEYTSLENGDTKDVNLTLSLVDTENVISDLVYTINDLQISKADGNYTSTSNDTAFSSDGSTISLSLEHILTTNAWTDVHGIFNYTLNIATPVNTSVINTIDGNITGTVNIGNTDYDIVNDDFTSLSLNSNTAGDLSLVSSGDRNSQISWDSNDTAIMSDAGVLAGSILDRLEDKDVTLTATIVNGEETKSKAITVTVDASTPANIVAYAKDNLSIGADLLNTTANITLDTNMTTDNGELIANIAWNTSNSAIITNTGVITTTVVDQNVTLDANISRDTASDIKTFNITVKADDAKIVASVINDVNTTVNSAYNLADVNSSISHFGLFYTGAYDTTISWESNDTSVVLNDGNITGRNFNEKTVKLTATVTSNAVSDTIDFVGTISPYSDTELVNMATTSLKVGIYDNNETAIISSELPLTTYNSNWDVNITWTSTGDTNQTFVNDTNSTIQRTDTQRNDVNLSATISRNSENVTKDFNANILASDFYIFQNDLASLDAGAAAQSTVAANATVIMPTTLTDGTTVVWDVTGQNVIAADGSITKSYMDQNVSVSATVTRGDTYSDTREYYVMVSADPDMYKVHTVKGIFDTNYSAYTMTLDNMGDAFIDLNTTNTEGITITWSGDNNMITSTLAAQDVSYTATFASNDYNETSTYNYTVAADANRAIDFADSNVTGSLGSLVESGTRIFTVNVVDGYGMPVSGETITFDVTGGNMSTPAVTDANGQTTATFTAGSAGSVSIAAKIGTTTLDSAIFSIISDPLISFNANVTSVNNDVSGITYGALPNTVFHFATQSGALPGGTMILTLNDSTVASVTYTSNYTGDSFLYEDENGNYYTNVNGIADGTVVLTQQ